MLKPISVRHKLYAVAGAATLAFALMAGVAWYTSSQIQTAMEDAEHLKATIARLEAMRLANAELVLAAMDSIVDRDKGRILPERQETSRQTSRRSDPTQRLPPRLRAPSAGRS